MSGISFNSILEREGIVPSDVSLILHTTRIPRLRRLLPIMVSERPDLFDAYQSVHSGPAEATLKNRPLAASFVPAQDRRLTFAGLFRIVAMDELAVEEIYVDPRFQELEVVFGATDTAPERNIARGGTQVRFTLTRLAEMSELIGRIQIAAPKTRAYVRRATSLAPDLVALSEESLLSPPAPDWREFGVTAPMMRELPQSWKARLREWRGVYLIVDEMDGERYVGSAYGEENLLGRWSEHVARDHGVTEELRKRDPVNFRFSILELLAPGADPGDVIRVERRWMDRLHTIEWGLNT